MADILDSRYDLFLRALRDSGNWETACTTAGLPIEAIVNKCRTDQKFDLTQTELHLEYLEEQIHKWSAKHPGAGADIDIRTIREYAMAKYRERHGE